MGLLACCTFIFGFNVVLEELARDVIFVRLYVLPLCVYWNLTKLVAYGSLACLKKLWVWNLVSRILYLFAKIVSYNGISILDF